MQNGKILVETRGNDGARKGESDFFSAILNPKASFGGLWAPKSLPKLDLREIENMSYGELSAHIFGKIGIDSAIDLGAYKNFDDKNLPLSYTRIAPNAFLQNLFTGPTRAFKDMAMQPFGALLCDLAKKRGENYLILTATSGDTGPATLEAIKNKENIFGICMFPKDGTSAVQRRQMTTIDAKNIAVLEVRGDFDTTQNALKNLLNDAEFGAFLDSQNLHLSASNSVNFGRIAFQIIYHGYNYIFLRQNGEIAEGECFDIVVPSGNFGNALGAFYAKIMGIPIAKIIIATNANCVLKDFISSGIYDLRNRVLIKTNSPAMDILKSSNVERVLFTLFGAERTKELMSDLEGQKYYELRSDELEKLQEFFSAYSFDDSAVEATIRHYAKEGILIDPHTANGILGANSASCGDNSVLGMQFRTCENFGESTDSSLVDSPNFPQIQKPYRNSQNLRAKRSNHHFDCDSQSESTTNQTQIAESALDSAESQNLIKKPCHSEHSEESKKNPSLRANPQDLRGNPPTEKTQKSQGGLPREQSSLAMTDFDGLPHSPALARNDSLLDSANRKIIICATAEWVKFVPTIKSALDSAKSQNLTKNNPCEAPENSPASWCKKSESKGAEVPPADFLLEADKRGSPPKSEKRQLLARRGSGVGGAALLREETSEISGEGIAESTRDSSVASLPQNDKIGADNDKTKMARNDEFRADSAPFDEKEAMQKIAQKFNLKIHKNIINLFDKEEKNCIKLSENEIKKAIISLCNKFLEN